jgi:hypothetical protein
MNRDEGDNEMKKECVEYGEGTMTKKCGGLGMRRIS